VGVLKAVAALVSITVKVTRRSCTYFYSITYVATIVVNNRDVVHGLETSCRISMERRQRRRYTNSVIALWIPAITLLSQAHGRPASWGSVDTPWLLSSRFSSVSLTSAQGDFPFSCPVPFFYPLGCPARHA
jgi:hypothetical protein